jgi:hypothetical protein
MNRKRERTRRPAPRVAAPQTTMDRARDELFSAIRQCGVLTADRDDQVEWMDDTLAFMKDRHPELSREELSQLREAGMRFCQPVIPHGREHTALAHEDANAA